VITSDSVSESNENLIGFIASTVETLRNDVATMRKQMATKEDLSRLDGRLSERSDRLSERLDGLTTDLATMHEEMATMREEMATMHEEMATMREEMATKDDLARLDGRFSEKLEVATTGIRGDIEQIQLRLDSMEHSISSRFEHVAGEISRLRGAVYILGKDRPEVLRLLGQTS